MKDITAIRNGIIRHFHPNTWAAFPSDKYGFVPVEHKMTEPPPVVVAAMQSVATTPQKPEPKQKKPRKKKGA